jgi:hypothetical protein
MQILVDPVSYHAQVEDFLRDFCPEHLKGQVIELLAVEDWNRLDELMQPFFNISI